MSEFNNNPMFNQMAKATPMSRLNKQIHLLQLLEQHIDETTKVVITPTRIGIKSNLKAGKAFDAQQAAVNKVVMEQGMLPFNVELVSHG